METITETKNETQMIAEFMGYEVINYQHGEFRPIYNGNKNAKTLGELKKLWGGLDLQFTGRFVEYVNFPFSTDWNYLIPIVFKIIDLKNVYGIEKQKILNSINPDINITYNAVIEFIKWYNASK